MHQPSILLLAYLLANVHAVPLNINLGAYSPALVVGDGEISFGGKQDVSNLMNALEGAAVSGAAAAAAAPAVEAKQEASRNPQPQATAVDAPIITPQAAQAVDETAQITALQGMGKEIAPRVVPFVKKGEEKRDLAGFTAALKYASDALKTSPGVELGTGEGGSGIGIKQAPGSQAAAPAAANAARVVLGKRQKSASPKVKTTVTTMFVRGGAAVPEVSKRQEGEVLEGRQNANEILYEKRQGGNETCCEKRGETDAAQAEKRSAPSSVNLNMAEGEIAELTFVETRAVEEDEEDDDSQGRDDDNEEDDDDAEFDEEVGFDDDE